MTLREQHHATLAAFKAEAEANGMDLGDFISAYTALVQDEARFQFKVICPPAKYGRAFLEVYADETVEEALAAKK